MGQMMDNLLIGDIRAYANAKTNPIPFPPASSDFIDAAERRLGFSLPPLLRRCYLEVGNGGFGPGYGIIGVEGGCASDFGNLVETYELFAEYRESEGNCEWQRGLLPFCEWGCNMYSCVDCIDPQYAVYLSEEGVPSARGYTFDKFFEMWVSGVDLLRQDDPDTEGVEIVNPFTGKMMRVFRRHAK